MLQQQYRAAGCAGNQASSESAFLQGIQRLLIVAEKANAGERIDSVLALLRLWASNTEEVVHETLQSERGLAATAALTRSALAYVKRCSTGSRLRWVLDMATRHDVDEAYREIQALKNYEDYTVGTLCGSKRAGQQAEEQQRQRQPHGQRPGGEEAAACASSIFTL
jgi:hypothetical protein